MMGLNKKIIFYIDDIVEIVSSCKNEGVEEVDGGLGVIGVIVDKNGSFYEIQSDEFILCNSWWFPDYALDLVESSAKTEVPVKKCPRCGGRLSEKNTESYGIILKCSNCGYC